MKNKIVTAFTLVTLALSSCASISTNYATKTLSPSATLPLTPVPRPTIILAAIPTYTLTLQIMQTTTSTPLAIPVNGYDVLLSPSGTKKAVYDAFLGRTIEIVDNGTVIWTITYDINKFNGTYGRLGEAWIKPFYWSKDENFLYYTCFHGGETDGSGKYSGNEFIDGCGVFRFDLNTGKTIDILPEIVPGNGYYAFSISPDERYLVYTYQNETPVQIKLLDLKTNEERTMLTASEDVLETGNFGWSPQSDKLVFVTLKIVGNEKRLYSIFILNLSTLKTKLIIENFDTRIRFISWDEKDIISYQPESGPIWQVGTTDKAFSVVTVTPFSKVKSTPTP